MYAKDTADRLNKCIKTEFNGCWDRAAKHFSVPVVFMADMAMGARYPTPRFLTWIDSVEAKNE